MALVIHVWTFSAWMCLLAIQAYVAASRRLNWHRKLGTAMLPLAVLMVWSGLASELQFHQRVIAGGGDSSDFFAITATYLTTFAILVTLAWSNRSDPPTHKRFVLLATAAILGGAHMRIWGDLWPDGWFDQSYAFRLFFYFGGSLIIVAFGMMHDLFARRHLHRVYLFGVPSLLLTYMFAVGLHDSLSWSEWIKPMLAGSAAQ